MRVKPPFDAGAEFDRQVATLLDKGYPTLTGLTGDAFIQLVTPLREAAVARADSMDPPTTARVPFVLVITRELAGPELLMPLTTLDGGEKPGFIDRNFRPGELQRFDPAKELGVPSGAAYLVFDVDRGKETLNIRPDDTIGTITDQGRTPITIDEGIAFITQFPASLQKNNCFSLLGSRCGDRRVPALWISEKAPKLGWCFAGVPHTWLGSASCAGRAGAPSGVPVS
jgi:hypothetical protein